MLNFRKISAASDGAAIRAYMTQEAPEPESLKVHGVALDPLVHPIAAGRDLAQLVEQPMNLAHDVVSLAGHQCTFRPRNA